MAKLAMHFVQMRGSGGKARKRGGWRLRVRHARAHRLQTLVHSGLGCPGAMAPASCTGWWPGSDADPQQPPRWRPAVEKQAHGARVAAVPLV
eukprot:scaffold3821_cov134-Isochrysis_galbana.AAC.14